MRYLTIFSVITLASFSLNAQGFITSFGTGENDYSREVFEVPNENAYISLYDNSMKGICKIDYYGNIIWEKTDENQIGHSNPRDYDLKIETDGFRLAFREFSNSISILKLKKYNYDGEVVEEIGFELPELDELQGVRILPDNSVICLSVDYENSTSSIFKISSNGTVLWSKTYSYNQLNVHNSDFKVLSNEEIIVVGARNGSFNPIVTKFNTTGEIIWQASLSLAYEGYGFVQPFPDDNSYFIYGKYGIGSINNNYIARLDSNGEILWIKDFSAYARHIDYNGILMGSNNTVYVTGEIIDSSGLKIFLLHLDEDGNVIWEKHYGEVELNYAGQFIRNPDGGFTIVSETINQNIGDSGIDPYIVKTDSLGEVIWSRFIEIQGSYNLSDIAYTSDKGCIILGYGDENIIGNYDQILTKIDSNGIIYSHVINGLLTFDENQNCNYEPEEQPLNKWKLKAFGNHTTYATTFADGSFWLLTNDDTVTVAANPPNECWTSCPEPVYAMFSAIQDTTTVELNAQAAKDCPLLEVDASTTFLRRCFPNTYFFTCTNTGTVTAENVQLTVLLDSFFIFQNASLPIASQNGNELVLNIGSLGINESKLFTIEVEVSCDAALGQIHCINFTAQADNQCSNTSRELSTTRECQSNIGAYDPNDKRAFTQGTLTERFIHADSIIEYQIRFQNTGTDTAFNVVVTDTLSSLLDIESIIAGASSHPYHMELERNNILKFVFKDIMLPDSNVNEAASHGFVKFRIRHKPVLVPGDVISNKAAIFFDFNEAVITNNLELEIKSPTVVKPPRPVPIAMLKVYPQPAGEVVVFELKSAAGQQPCRLEILNILGQKLYDQAIKEGANSVSHLPAGQHFYRLWRDGGVVEVGKVMVVGN